MTTSDQELTIADLNDIRWRWLRPETALREHDHKQLQLVFDALLASQKALREIADFVMDSRTRGYDNDPRIADMAEAALLRLGEGENSDAS